MAIATEGSLDCRTGFLHDENLTVDKGVLLVIGGVWNTGSIVALITCSLEGEFITWQFPRLFLLEAA